MKSALVAVASALAVAAFILTWRWTATPSTTQGAASAAVPLFAPETLGGALPLSIGVRTLGDTATMLIPAGTPLPSSRRETFSTSTDGQTTVPVRVVAGESRLASACSAVGTFTITAIPPMPRGMPVIEVTFEVDAQGTLRVSAVDKTSDQPLVVTLEAPLAAALSAQALTRLREADRAGRERTGDADAGPGDAQSLRRKLRDLSDITRQRLEAGAIPDLRIRAACEAALARAERVLQAHGASEATAQGPATLADHELAAAFRELVQAAMLGGPAGPNLTSSP